MDASAFITVVFCLLVVFVYGRYTVQTDLKTKLESEYKRGFEEGRNSVDLEQAIQIVSAYQDRFIRARQSTIPVYNKDVFSTNLIQN